LELGLDSCRLRGRYRRFGRFSSYTRCNLPGFNFLFHVNKKLYIATLTEKKFILMVAFLLSLGCVFVCVFLLPLGFVGVQGIGC